MFAKITAFFTAIMTCITAFISLNDIKSDYIFTIDAGTPGKTAVNMAQCVNVWEMGTQFINAENNKDNDIFEFTEYVQLMACSGGTESRDMFKDPYDNTVKDDYDFSVLIKNCRGILALGAKPHLKFGNVPMKYTTNPQKGVFSDNVNPPDDYDVYYDYIAAIAKALCDEFGKEEVLTWHYGVMTEFENSDWFIAKNGSPASTAAAYCRLYDYTVAALQDVIGEDIYVGAHAMSVTEGLWDEEIFIRHCANGINYKTGTTGSRICYLAGSFYDSAPGVYTGGYNLPGTINNLRKKAEKYGLYGLDYGIDEGRILEGKRKGTEKSDLFSRSTGFTWQAAYDARLYGQMLDNDISYFSYWDYLSNGLLSGLPSVSYYTAREISKFAGGKLLDVSRVKARKSINTEINTYAVFNEENNTLRAFTYNYSKRLNNKTNKNVKLVIDTPQFKDGDVQVTVYKIDDNCNFFDDWEKDRKTYNITDDMFTWSSDDFMIDAVLQNGNARDLYFGTLYENYKEASKLTPETFTAEVNNGTITLNSTINANTVVFFEISQY